MVSLLNKALFALRFFTRLPIPGGNNADDDLASTALTFPLVGLVIGGLISIVWAVSAFLLPALPAAGIAITAGILITGALHEDGFSDCADGLGGGFTKEKALEIMRDSRIGAYGAIAMVFTIGLRWSALAELTILGGVTALLIAHMVSRNVIITALATSTYARDKGLGSSVSAGTTIQTLLIASTFTLTISLLIGGLPGFIATLIGTGIAWLFLQYLIKRLSGYTGDGLGAMQQLAEISVFLTLAGFWGS